MMAFNRSLRYSDDPASSEIQRLLNKKRQLRPSKYVGSSGSYNLDTGSKKSAINRILSGRKKLRASTYIDGKAIRENAALAHMEKEFRRRSI